LDSQLDNQDLVVQNEISAQTTSLTAQLEQSDDDIANDTATPKKKTLSTSSISSTSSTLSSTSSSSSSSSTPSSTPLYKSLQELDSASPDLPPISESTVDTVSSTVTVQFQEIEDAPEPGVGSSPVTSNDSVTKTESQEDIKEVQIETEDPSHLFWVPFHLHPEIAPNEYNRWLSKHGVDSDGSGSASILAARKESVNRRKSVLSTLYNPEDEEDDEETEDKSPENADEQKPKPIAEQDGGDEEDPLPEMCSAPLEKMGEPLLMTKTSLRRSSSHTQVSHSPSHSNADVPGDIAEDFAAAKRGSGLTRRGPSLLRRSARTKIRRDSNASSEIKNDTSRLRSELIENGEYPAVTLVDPGPIPLPSPSSSDSLPLAELTGSDTTKVDDPVPIELVQKPLKRFVSTLRDPSKPTITTYIEPELLEQCQKEIESSSRSLKTLTTLTIADASTAKPQTLAPSKEPIANLSYESVITSKVTYPIPPPVKLSQNLLQPPTQQSPAASVRPSMSAQPPMKQHTINENQLNSSGGPSIPPNSKKSLSWSWLWGKEKGSDKVMDAAPRQHQKSPMANSQQQQQQLLDNNTMPIETVTKKQSTLSLLFSRNGKTTSKVQASSVGNGVTSAPAGSLGQSQGDYLNDPSRMPIHIERAIYRMSHIKLANVRRPLHEQVLISNMMFWYLGVIQQQQLEQNVNMQQQQQQQVQPQKQQQQQSQALLENRVGHGKSDSKESIQSISAKQKALKKKKSQQDVLISESKVEGSEYIVPQQDSNSHARSPCKDVVQGITHAQSLHRPSPLDDVEYDEESMIGGGFSEDFDWDEEVEEEGRYEEDGAGSLYLQEGVQVAGGYKARGPKKHLKRLNAPKHWMLDKLTGTYAPRPTAGPHKLRECLPLIILLRNRL
ncbi:40S ribosomal protein S4, X isoform, partial [Mortierella sp. AD094]